MKIFRILISVCLLLSYQTLADYAEECLSEGCSDHEVEELYESYDEECLNEGCSREEVIELAGGPQFVNQMLQDFRDRGFEVAEEDSGASQCRGTGTMTQCAVILLLCQDWYFCPDAGPDQCQPDDLFCPGGNTQSSWYVCGGCFGFSWF